MTRVYGHFGELLQGRIGSFGPVALVTLPCPTLYAEAGLTQSRAFGLYQSQKALAPTALRHLLQGLGLPVRGKFFLRLSMPLGGGAGASTAALLALGMAAGAQPGVALEAAVLAAEGASDPLLHARPERVLWASRLGVVLEDLPPLPRFEVLGGFLGPGQRTDPLDHHFPDISDLLAAWPGPDLATMANLASQSARRTLALRGPANDPTEDLARRHGALGFCMKVIYHNRNRVDAAIEAECKATYVSKQDLLQQADHVVLVLPYSKESHHTIGEAELALMKPTATITNIARGGIIDDAALAKALQQGQIAAAGLDVFENEPRLNPELLKCRNIVMTPHIGSGTLATRLAMANLATHNLIAFFSEGKALTPLNPEVLGLA